MAVTGFGRKLTWKDFKAVGKSPDPDGHLAFTMARAGVSGKGVDCAKGTCTARMAFYVDFKPLNSWYVKGNPGITDALLSHEQGHYDIAALAARDMERDCAAATGTDRTTLLAEIKKIIDRVGDQMDQLMIDYDFATSNGGDSGAQGRWHGKIVSAKADAKKTLNDVTP